MTAWAYQSCAVTSVCHCRVKPAMKRTLRWTDVRLYIDWKQHAINVESTLMRWKDETARFSSCSHARKDAPVDRQLISSFCKLNSRRRRRRVGSNVASQPTDHTSNDISRVSVRFVCLKIRLDVAGSDRLGPGTRRPSTTLSIYCFHE